MGMRHDQETGCGTNQGIMGLKRYGWSTCSASNL